LLSTSLKEAEYDDLKRGNEQLRVELEAYQEAQNENLNMESVVRKLLM